ncbi:hypothetical protein EAE99_011297 [Botrytis elliptica]|nr:hypothetical protein EAE99_011297 [Botrytis elliptica]
MTPGTTRTKRVLRSHHGSVVKHRKVKVIKRSKVCGKEIIPSTSKAKRKTSNLSTLPIISSANTYTVAQPALSQDVLINCRAAARATIAEPGFAPKFREMFSIKEIESCPKNSHADRIQLLLGLSIEGGLVWSYRDTPEGTGLFAVKSDNKSSPMKQVAQALFLAHGNMHVDKLPTLPKRRALSQRFTARSPGVEDLDICLPFEDDLVTYEREILHSTVLAIFYWATVIIADMDVDQEMLKRSVRCERWERLIDANVLISVFGELNDGVSLEKISVSEEWTARLSVIISAAADDVLLYCYANPEHFDYVKLLYQRNYNKMDISCLEVPLSGALFY